MAINMNDPHTVTFDNVRKLLGSGRTDTELEIRVTHGGDVVLSEITGPEGKDDVCFRIGDMNMNPGDAEFIGPAAAAATDDRLVDQVLTTLEKYWKHKPASGLADLEPY
jgi:hypothetical protein